MHVTEGCNTKQRSGSESDVKSYRHSMGETILSYMLSNVENEEAYLHYFRQLISFEGGLNKEDGSNVFDIVHLNHNDNKRGERVKRSNTDFKRETSCLTKSKHTRPNILELRVESRLVYLCVTGWIQ